MPPPVLDCLSVQLSVPQLVHLYPSAETPRGHPPCYVAALMFGVRRRGGGGELHSGGAEGFGPVGWSPRIAGCIQPDTQVSIQTLKHKLHIFTVQNLDLSFLSVI